MWNAVKGETQKRVIEDKMQNVKYAMEELGTLQDDVVSFIGDGDEDKHLLDTEEKWYYNYDKKANEAIKLANMYLEQSFPENRPPSQSYVKLQRLEIPKFKSDPKNFHKCKGMFERYTKECGDEEKYDYSILPITRTSKGPMKMVRVSECSSYPG